MIFGKKNGMAATLVISAMTSSVKAWDVCPKESDVIPFDTLVLVTLPPLDQVSNTYLTEYLPSLGSRLTNYNAIDAQNSIPNYLALISGSTFGAVDATYKTIAHERSFVEKFEQQSKTWKAYYEGYQGGCYRGSDVAGSEYTRIRNPFVWLETVFSNADRIKTRCGNVAGAEQFEKDVAAGLPNFVIYAPGKESAKGEEKAVQFLKSWLEPKLTDPKYARTLFVVTSERPASGSSTGVYAVLIGSGLKTKGFADASAYSHYSVLASVLWNFRMGYVNGDTDGKAKRFDVICNPPPPTTSTTSTATTATTTPVTTSTTLTSLTTSTTTTVPPTTSTSTSTSTTASTSSTDSTTSTTTTSTSTTATSTATTVTTATTSSTTPGTTPSTSSTTATTETTATTDSITSSKTPVTSSSTTTASCPPSSTTTTPPLTYTPSVTSTVSPVPVYSSKAKTGGQDLYVSGAGRVDAVIGLVGAVVLGALVL
ncbi:hypothetical protein HDU97_001344 [Phlyctochytrium planicorne]|nr:hypothetical protein HDU97_001344 [Phlyctochytrium planicorne]